MADSEYFLQLFLFGATLFCYLLLLIFVLYGTYYCCLRSCLKVRRRRLQERKEQDAENHSYRGHVQLINPFQVNNKVSIVSNSNAHPSQRQHDDNDNEEAITSQDDFNLNATNSEQPDELNSTHFVDKKYYDIFVA